LTSGTVFASTKLPLTTWFLAIYLLTQSKNAMSALELKRQLGVSYNTAWLLKHKILHVMKERDDSRPLDGLVQIDDAYWGGERRGGKRGRGAPGKTPFVAAVACTPDGLSAFRGVAGAGCVHEPHVTGGGPESVQYPNFRWVNTILGNVMRSMERTMRSGKNIFPAIWRNFATASTDGSNGRPPSPVCVCCGQNVAPSLQVGKAS
jgi:hypothetical protein